ncbi:hypothetical protein P167DRAFT_495646 [Morchella conica CCBAS932]|uniref:Fungal N-terminal domain-containing protein n=1 Tax=Morchella conica CCBAS932 TaxID=1392247 RepID=A0A3N4KDY8_9PEZI|nr:hypothetical protein P167DRAFT_495646 [Morchella conica CCBAS932]
MSFGFGVGDFIAVSQLAWNLYRYCYVVSRGAPQEFQLLLQEITTLSQSIKLLELEAQDPNSTLVRSGEDRIRMVKEMMSRVEVTLKELEKHAKKYEKLGDSSRSKVRKQLWAKFKWSVDASDLDALRNKLVYHNGVINLLLTSCGNSSLQRIESSTQKLERRFSRIDELVQKFESQGSPEAPSISAVNDKALKKTLLSMKLMENAEVGKRRWSAIGVDEWIQAGRWWLLKSQSDLSAGLASDGRVSHQAYTNLVKASWILIDVIAKHPQFNLLDPSIQYDAEVLAEVSRYHDNLKTWESFLKDSIRLSETNLRIWIARSFKSPHLRIFNFVTLAFGRRK